MVGVSKTPVVFGAHSILPSPFVCVSRTHIFVPLLPSQIPNSLLGILLLSSMTDLPQLVVWVACCAGAADAYVNSLKTLF